MAVSVPSETSYSFNASSDSRSVTVDASSNLLLVKTFTRVNPGAWTVTYNGTSLTSLFGTQNAGSVIYGDFWYLVSPPTGAHTMVVSIPNFHPTVVEVMGIAGANTSTPFGVTGTKTANPGTGGTIVLASSIGNLCTDMFGMEAATDSTLSISGGDGSSTMTQIRQGDGGTNFERVGASQAAGAASISLSWSISASKTMLQLAAEVKASVGGGSSSSTLMSLGIGS